MKEIEVPSYWEEYELTDATTFYGNPVRIPKKWLDIWEFNKKRFQRMVDRGWDPKDGSENPLRPMAQDMLETILELYHKPD